MGFYQDMMAPRAVRVRVRCASFWCSMAALLLALAVVMEGEGAGRRTVLQIEEADDFAICGGKNHPCGVSRPCSPCKSIDFKCKPQVDSETGEKNAFFWQCLPRIYKPVADDIEKAKTAVEAVKQSLFLSADEIRELKLMNMS